MKRVGLALIITTLIFLCLTINVSAWWDNSYHYRYPIYSTATIAELPIAINDTYDVVGQTLWARNCTEQCYIYCQSSGCGSGNIAIANNTDEKYWANDSAILGGNQEDRVFEPAEIMLRYGFGNGSGSTVFDFSTSRNNGTVNADPVWNSSGVFGYGMTFNGDDAISDSSSWQTETNFTIIFWFRHNDSTTEDSYPIVAGTGHGGLATTIELGRAGVQSGCATPRECALIKFIHTVDYNYWFNFSRNSNWNMYAFTKNETNLSFWQNGTYMDSNTTTITEVMNATYFMRNRDNNTWANGTLEEFRVYNRTLTKTEIQQMYWNGINNLTSLGAEEVIPNTPPIVNLISPPNLTTTADSTPNLIFNFTDTNQTTANCSAYVNSTLVGYNSSAMNATSTTITSSVLTVGYKSWNISCNDTQSVNNTGNSPTWFLTIGTNISVTTPTNTTYYNNYSLSLNVVNYTNISTWWYSLNGASNVSFTPNTTFVPLLGSQNITIWANDTLGFWHNHTVWFTTEFICNVSYIGATNRSYRCMGTSMNYLAPCRQFGYDTFQWDTTNMTLCKYGCRNGVCLNASHATCYNRCNASDTTCSSDGRYLHICENQTDGCYDWNYENRTFCNYGCYNGKCIAKISLCTVGRSKCEDNHIVYCDDDDDDGYYEWSKYNRTFCNYGCKTDFNASTNDTIATCNYHSFNVSTAFRKSLDNVAMAVGIIFPPSSLLATMLTLFIILLLSALATFFTKSWEVGLVTAFGVMFLGMFLGVIPLFMVIIFIIIGGVIFYKRA